MSPRDRGLRPLDWLIPDHEGRRPMLDAPHADGGTPPVAAAALTPSPGLPDDAALLACVAARDGDTALGTLYDRYGRQAFAVAYRMVQNPEVAEEVVQDAFLAVWRRAEQYAPARGDVRGWLLTIVRNRAVDHLRARQVRPQPAAVLEDVGAWLTAPDDTSAAALGRLEASAMRAAVAMLPPLQRQTVELAYFSSLSYPEVAAKMGAPLGTVKGRMRLALIKLRTVLGPTPVVG